MRQYLEFWKSPHAFSLSCVIAATLPSQLLRLARLKGLYLESNALYGT